MNSKTLSIILAIYVLYYHKKDTKKFNTDLVSILKSYTSQLVANNYSSYPELIFLDVTKELIKTTDILSTDESLDANNSIKIGRAIQSLRTSLDVSFDNLVKLGIMEDKLNSKELPKIINSLISLIDSLYSVDEHIKYEEILSEVSEYLHVKLHLKKPVVDDFKTLISSIKSISDQIVSGEDNISNTVFLKKIDEYTKDFLKKDKYYSFVRYCIAYLKSSDSKDADWIYENINLIDQKPITKAFEAYHKSDTLFSIETWDWAQHLSIKEIIEQLNTWDADIIHNAARSLGIENKPFTKELKDFATYLRNHFKGKGFGERVPPTENQVSPPTEKFTIKNTPDFVKAVKLNFGNFSPTPPFHISVKPFVTNMKSFTGISIPKFIEFAEKAKFSGLFKSNIYLAVSKEATGDTLAIDTRNISHVGSWDFRNNPDYITIGKASISKGSKLEVKVKDDKVLTGKVLNVDDSALKMLDDRSNRILRFSLNDIKEYKVLKKKILLPKGFEIVHLDDLERGDYVAIVMLPGSTKLQGKLKSNGNAKIFIQTVDGIVGVQKRNIIDIGRDTSFNDNETKTEKVRSPSSKPPILKPPTPKKVQLPTPTLPPQLDPKDNPDFKPFTTPPSSQGVDYTLAVSFCKFLSLACAIRYTKLLPKEYSYKLIAFGKESYDFYDTYGSKPATFKKWVPLLGNVNAWDEKAWEWVIKVIIETYANKKFDNISSNENISAVQVSIIRDSCIFLRRNSDPAYSRLTKNVSYLKIPFLSAIMMPKGKTIDYRKMNEELKNLVSVLTGEPGDIISEKERKKASETYPEVYQEYLVKRRELIDFYKSKLLEKVRMSGDFFIDAYETRKEMISEGMLTNIPEGYKGYIDEKGGLYTTAGKKIEGVPTGKVVMNSKYDPELDDTYVFKGQGFGSENWGAYYTEDYRGKATKSKFEVVNTLIGQLPALSEKWRSHLLNDSNTDRQTKALLVELLFITQARIGSSGGSTGGVKTYGLSVLEGRHLKIVNAGAKLKYLGKAGKEQIHIISPNSDRFSKKAYQILSGIKDITESKQFLFLNSKGIRVTETDVRGYMKSIGFPTSAGPHKLRHARGTLLAQKLLNHSKFKDCDGSVPDIKLFQQDFEDMMKQVGKLLGHKSGENVTAMTAIKNYIDPNLMINYFNKCGVRLPKYLEKLAT